MKRLDSPVKPENDGLGPGFPGPAFAMAMDGQASRGMTGVVAHKLDRINRIIRILFFHGFRMKP
jgi:hypothetical protein